jgi:hypothetical protein
MYPIPTILHERGRRQKSTSDVVPSAGLEADRIGGSSFCKYNDAVIDRIEFEVTRKNRGTSAKEISQPAPEHDFQPTAG